MNHASCETTCNLRYYSITYDSYSTVGILNRLTMVVNVIKMGMWTI